MSHRTGDGLEDPFQLVTGESLAVIETGLQADDFRAPGLRRECAEKLRPQRLPVQRPVVELVTDPHAFVDLRLVVQLKAPDRLLAEVERGLVRPFAGHVGKLGIDQRNTAVGPELGFDVFEIEVQSITVAQFPSKARVQCRLPAGADLAVVVGLKCHAVQSEVATPVRAGLVPVHRALDGREAADSQAQVGKAGREGLLADDVDDTGQRIDAVKEPGRPLEHLDPGDVVHRVPGSFGLDGAVGQDQAAADRIEATDQEVIVDSPLSLDVEAADVAQRVAEVVTVLLGHQSFADRPHVGRRQLGRQRQLGGDGVRRRQLGDVDLDVLAFGSRSRFGCGAFGRLFGGFFIRVVRCGQQWAGHQEQHDHTKNE